VRAQRTEAELKDKHGVDRVDDDGGRRRGEADDDADGAEDAVDGDEFGVKEIALRRQEEVRRGVHADALHKHTCIPALLACKAEHEDGDGKRDDTAA